MSSIKEIIIEPSKVHARSIFKVKVKIEDDSLLLRQIKSEDNQMLISENGKQIITEWSV